MIDLPWYSRPIAFTFSGECALFSSSVSASTSKSLPTTQVVGPPSSSMSTALINDCLVPRLRHTDAKWFRPPHLLHLWLNAGQCLHPRWWEFPQYWQRREADLAKAFRCGRTPFVEKILALACSPKSVGSCFTQFSSFRHFLHVPASTKSSRSSTHTRKNKGTKSSSQFWRTSRHKGGHQLQVWSGVALGKLRVLSGEWRIITAWPGVGGVFVMWLWCEHKGSETREDCTQEPERREARLCVGCWPSSIVGKFR